MLTRNKKTATRKAAKNLAQRLVKDYRANRLSFGAAVAQCSGCLDSKVGAEAFKIFRREVRGGGKS